MKTPLLVIEMKYCSWINAKTWTTDRINDQHPLKTSLLTMLSKTRCVAIV